MVFSIVRSASTDQEQRRHSVGTLWQSRLSVQSVARVEPCATSIYSVTTPRGVLQARSVRLTAYATPSNNLITVARYRCVGSRRVTTSRPPYTGHFLSDFPSRIGTARGRTRSTFPRASAARYVTLSVQDSDLRTEETERDPPPTPLFGITCLSMAIACYASCYTGHSMILVAQSGP